MPRVAIGSKNAVKVRAVKKAWTSMMGEAEFLSIDPPRYTHQPVGLDETLDLARMRARYSLEQVGADYGVGIEAGLIKVYGGITGYIDTQVCVILDRNGLETIGFSAGFEFPPQATARAVRERVELGKTMEELCKRRDIGRMLGAVGVLTRGVITRTDLSFQAVVMALIPRINARLYFEH